MRFWPNAVWPNAGMTGGRREGREGQERHTREGERERDTGGRERERHGREGEEGEEGEGEGEKGEKEEGGEKGRRRETREARSCCLEVLEIHTSRHPQQGLRVLGVPNGLPEFIKDFNVKKRHTTLFDRIPWVNDPQAACP